MKENPKLSVVIPTYNEEREIGLCLNSLNKQSYKNFEVLVVDDGSTDATRKIVKMHRGVKLIKGEHKGPGFSRNKGAKEAKGDLLIFVDADMTFDKDYLKNLVFPWKKNKRLFGTTHDLEVADNTKNVWSRCWGRIRVDGKKSQDARIFRAITKKRFIELGGFNPKYGYADDQTFWMDHGLKPVFAENTTCYHKNPERLKDVYKQSRWIGASLNYKIFRMPFWRYLALLLLVIVSPIVVPILAVKKSFSLKDFGIFLPWMVLFMAARYFGTIAGVIRKVYLKKNYR
ncbi:MAG: glycosyltransferase family A protein [archaeon]